MGILTLLSPLTLEALVWSGSPGCISLPTLHPSLVLYTALCCFGPWVQGDFLVGSSSISFLLVLPGLAHERDAQSLH
jgi:hypothetical protein